MKKYLKNNKNIIFLLCLFMIIQPFIDMKVLFDNPHLSILGITIPTIIRTLFIGFIGLYMFYKNDNKKEKKWILIYFIVIAIYSLIHHIIDIRPLDVPDSFKYSIITEAFYVVRMVLPLMLIYITKYAKISYDKFINVILYSSITIGLVIIISNTFLISYTSYGVGITSSSWLSWLSDISSYEFEELTSKGWFYMANQVAGLTLLLLPFCVYDFINKISFKNVLAVVSLTFSMIILGTRTSAYGWVLVYIIMIFIPIFLHITKLHSVNYKSIGLLVFLFVIFVSLLLISPVQKRIYTSDLKPDIPPEGIVIDGDIYKYIEENYKRFGIQKIYIEDLYSYKYDYVFWLDIFYRSKEIILDNREIELLITNRIVSRNNNRLYDLFGYSFSRMRNGQIYIEKDFYAQKVTIGYIGMIILFIPYFISIISLCLKVFKNKKTCFGFITFLISIFAIFGSSLFTGHILDELFVMLYVGFIIGYFLSIGGKNESKC